MNGNRKCHKYFTVLFFAAALLGGGVLLGVPEKAHAGTFDDISFFLYTTSASAREMVSGFEGQAIRLTNFTRERAPAQIYSLQAAVFDSVQDAFNGVVNSIQSLFTTPPIIQPTADDQQSTTEPRADLKGAQFSRPTLGSLKVDRAGDVFNLSAIKAQIIAELSGKGLVTNTIIEKPTIIERAVERIVGGITQTDLDAQSNIINNKLLAQVADLKNLIATRSDQNFSAIALTQKIDNLSGTTLSNVSFSGSVSGITDASVPDNITASNYLPLAGGTIAGNLTITGTCTGCGDSSYLTLSDWYATTTSDIAEGTNLYWTDNRFYNRLSATTTLPNLTTLLGLVNATSAQLTTTGNTYLATLSGNVGVGTSSPYAKLSVSGSGVFANNVLAGYFTATSTTATSTFRGGAVFGYDNSALSNFGETVDVLGSFAVENPAGTDNFFVGSNGRVGVGTTTPWRKLSVSDTSANPQMNLAYDNSNYAELTVSATGDLRISASGGDIGFLNENLRVCAGDACPTDPTTLTGNGNILAEGGIFADAFNPATCPTGMIPVPASPADGKIGFCVDKYEEKSVSGLATSQAASAPWVSIAQYNARAACILAGKHLITEAEWLAIAHNIENVGWNWNGGVAGTNQMSNGHSDSVPANSLAADVTGNADDDPCVGTGQTCSLTVWDSQRRTYKLSNGEYIWDLGGNVWEWEDQINDSDYPVYNSAAAGWLACATTGDGVCGNLRTTNDQWYRGGMSTVVGFLRGGGWADGALSGAFALNLYGAPGFLSAGIGFRCAR